MAVTTRERVVGHPPRHPDDEVADPVDPGPHEVQVGRRPEPAGHRQGAVVRQVSSSRSCAQAHSLASTRRAHGAHPERGQRAGERAVGRLRLVDLVVAELAEGASRRRTSQRKSSSPSRTGGMPSPAAQRRSRSVSDPVRAQTRAATTASGVLGGPLPRPERREQPVGGLRDPAQRRLLLRRREEERHDLVRQQGHPW